LPANWAARIVAPPNRAFKSLRLDEARWIYQFVRPSMQPRRSALADLAVDPAFAEDVGLSGRRLTGVPFRGFQPVLQELPQLACWEQSPLLASHELLGAQLPEQQFPHGSQHFGS